MNRHTLDKWFDDAVRHLDLQANAVDSAAAALEAAGMPAATAKLAEVNKLTAYFPVSCCTMTDATGDDYCQHGPPAILTPIKHPFGVGFSGSRVSRWRFRVAAWRYTWGTRIGTRLAGEQLAARWDWPDDE